MGAYYKLMMLCKHINPIHSDFRNIIIEKLLLYSLCVWIFRPFQINFNRSYMPGRIEYANTLDKELNCDAGEQSRVYILI